MLETLEEGLLSAGLVDLDGTFIVQLGIFLLFFILLNFILIRPMMKARDERYSRMQGARKDAEELDLRAADVAEEYESKLDTARRSAVEVRDELRAGAEKDRDKMLSKVRSEVEQQLASRAAERKAELEKARADMDKLVDELSDLAVARIMADRADGADGGQA